MSESTTTVDPVIQRKIIKQVNFYFSDSNLPFDKFLWTLTKKNAEGWVPLETIASFKKMQMLTKDLNTVVSALKSQPSELYELNEAGTQIRRKTPLVEQNMTPRTIYAKGFPLVDQDVENPQERLLELQDKVDEFFSEHGTVYAVRLRKTDERPSKFKGSVFVEFSTPQEAEAVVQKKLQFEGQDLLLKMKEQYVKEKAELYKDQPRKPSGKKRKFNAFREEEFQSKKKTTGGQKKSKKDADENAEGKTEAKAEEKAETETEKKEDETKQEDGTQNAAEEGDNKAQE